MYNSLAYSFIFFVEQIKEKILCRTKNLNSWRKIKKNGVGSTDKIVASKFDEDDFK